MRKDAYIKISPQKVFRALSDNTRIKIICMLHKAKKPLCVCELMDALDKAHYNISRHLKELKKAGIVNEYKEGRWVFYSIVNTDTNFFKKILSLIEEIPEDFFKPELDRLRLRLSLRQGGKCVIGIGSKNLNNFLRKHKMKGKNV